MGALLVQTSVERLCLRKTFPISSSPAPCLPAQLPPMPVTPLALHPRVCALQLVEDSKICCPLLYFGIHLKDRAVEALLPCAL